VTSLSQALAEKRLKVEEALHNLYVPGRAPEVEAAVAHSLFAPAKRLRPILSLLVCEAFHGAAAAVLPAGVEPERWTFDLACSRPAPKGPSF
jgi:geranylgeranyl pyrophosphate synthase